MKNITRESAHPKSRVGSGTTHQNRVLTFREFSNQLGLPQALVRSLVRKQKIRAVSTAGGRRIPSTELTRLCAFDCARAFCGFLWEVPRGFTFNLWNLQGVLRFANRGTTPDEEDYSEPLWIAIEEGWIKSTEQPDTYERTGHPPSAYARYGLSTVEHKLILALQQRHRARFGPDQGAFN